MRDILPHEGRGDQTSGRGHLHRLHGPGGAKRTSLVEEPALGIVAHRPREPSRTEDGDSTRRSGPSPPRFRREGAPPPMRRTAAPSATTPSRTKSKQLALRRRPPHRCAGDPDPTYVSGSHFAPSASRNMVIAPTQSSAATMPKATACATSQRSAPSPDGTGSLLTSARCSGSSARARSVTPGGVEPDLHTARPQVGIGQPRRTGRARPRRPRVGVSPWETSVPRRRLAPPEARPGLPRGEASGAAGPGPAAVHSCRRSPGDHSRVPRAKIPRLGQGVQRRLSRRTIEKIRPRSSGSGRGAPRRPRRRGRSRRRRDG